MFCGKTKTFSVRPLISSLSLSSRFADMHPWRRRGFIDGCSSATITHNLRRPQTAHKKDGVFLKKKKQTNPSTISLVLQFSSFFFPVVLDIISSLLTETYSLGMHDKEIAKFLNFISLACSVKAKSNYTSYTAELHRLLSWHSPTHILILNLRLFACGFFFFFFLSLWTFM